MSTDFSIRPVGVPVAPSFPPATSSAAQSSVPTQLPSSQTVTATDAGTASSYAQSASSQLSKQAYFDTQAASVVFQSVDDLTGQVVTQYPDDATLRRRAYFHSLDQSKGQHPLATDLTV
jgi:hypothetical protein